MIRTLAVFALASLLAAPSYAQNAAPPLVTARIVPKAEPSAPTPVVLELFTSQGCAFCPPADELMGQMIKQEGVIGLSCHVDYFTVRKNNLGKAFCTARQSYYNRLVGTGPRYTPQLIVNGHMDMIGYEAGKVSAAIMKARSEKIRPIAFTETNPGLYSYTLPAVGAEGDPVALWLAVYDPPKSIAVTEGNNLGKKITYYNVVSNLRDLGTWNGAPEVRVVEAPLQAEGGGFAIIAQNARTGHILAAGSVKKAEILPTAAP